jgi:hypothetical protein
MKPITAFIIAGAFFSLPAAAQQPIPPPGKSGTAPGQTEQTPGQKQNNPGDAKNLAPGRPGGMTPPGQTQREMPTPPKKTK